MGTHWELPRVECAKAARRHVVHAFSIQSEFFGMLAEKFERETTLVEIRTVLDSSGDVTCRNQPSVLFTKCMLANLHMCVGGFRMSTLSY